MKTTAIRFFLAVSLCAFSAQAAATSPPADVARVEEDWELHLDTPNLAKNTPQFVTHFKIDEDTFILTCFNFRDYPSHDPGGIQMQLWHQGAVVDTVEVSVDNLDVSGEVIRWTHVYNGCSCDVEAKLENIDSLAWGQISSTASITQNPSSISSLNHYDPADSVAESHVNYGRNAVVWFGMTESRTYDIDGNPLSTDTASRVVFAR
jgi:hypothetical protein